MAYKILAARYDGNISVLELGSDGKELKLLSTTPFGKRPSWILKQPGREVYATVDEVRDYPNDRGAMTGAVRFFTFDKSSNAVTEVVERAQETFGATPCSMDFSHSGDHVFTAAYVGGVIAALDCSSAQRTLPAGVKVGDPTRHGPHPTRQTASHMHAVLCHPTLANVVYAVDLGTDSVYTYNYTPDSKEDDVLELASTLELETGSGSRHIAFNASGTKAYVIGELVPVVTVHAVDLKTGSLSAKPLARLDLRTHDSGPKFCGSEIAFAPGPKQRFLYVTLRDGPEQIAVLDVGEDGNQLHEVQRCETALHPRHFGFTTDARYVLVGAQFSNTVHVYARDAQSGRLTQTTQLQGLKEVCYLIDVTK